VTSREWGEAVTERGPRWEEDGLGMGEAINCEEAG
jgi:hypothetical protein